VFGTEDIGKLTEKVTVRMEGHISYNSLYRGTDKSLARPTSRYIFFMVRIFPLMLVLC